MGLSYNKNVFKAPTKPLDNEPILHITQLQNWREAQQKGYYQTTLFETEKFIHCARVHQIIEVANYLFAGQHDLVLLWIDPEKLASELRYEAFGLPEAYPHIYGPINLEAVVKVINFPPNQDGFFQLPKTITSQ